MWDEKLELLDRSYSVSVFQDYFEYIIKKLKTEVYNTPIRIYVNKIENRIAFKIKRGCYLEILTPKTMK